MAQATEKKRQKFPTVRWFDDNDTPIKKVSVGEQDIESIPEKDRGIVALTTHSLVERRVITMGVLIAVLSSLVLLGLVFLAFSLSDIFYFVIFDADLISFARTVFIIAGILLIIGSLIAPSCHSALKGFRLLSGEVYLCLSYKYQRLIRDFCRLSFVWGWLIILIQSAAWKCKTKKYENPSVIALPENCGFGQWIEKHTKQPKGKKQKPLKEPDEKEQRYNKNSIEAIRIAVCEGMEWASSMAGIRRRRTLDPFPDKKWFKQNGTPIKEINIHTEVLNSMSADELDLISVSSYALVKTRIKIITAFAWLVGISFVVALPIGLPLLFLADMWAVLILGLFWFFSSVVVGSVFMLPCNTMLEGFLHIDGVERLCLDASYKKKIKALSRLSFVWGCVLILILAYFGGLRNGVEYYLHIGIPENCGYDEMIALYVAAERASMDDVINALQKRSNDREHDKYNEKLDKLLAEVKEDKKLTDKQKQELNDEADEKRAESDERYGAAQGSLDEQYEQDIKPVYDGAMQAAAHPSSIERPYAEYAARQMKAQIGEHIVNEVEDYIMPGTHKKGMTAAEADKKYAPANIALPTVAFQCLFVSICFFCFASAWGFVPLILGVAFAIVAIVIHYKTNTKSIIKITSLTATVLFACLAILMSTEMIIGSGAADGLLPNSGYMTFSYDAYYNKISGETEISIYYCNQNTGSVIIPSKIKGKPVTKIMYGTFADCSGITSITVPNSVTNIEYRAFEGCSSLTSITLPFVGTTGDATTDTRFGGIFGAGYYDTSEYIPSTLKTVIITDATSIGEYAFFGCSSLTSIEIPNSVTRIGYNAFSGCSSLTSIEIPNSVTSIGGRAFSGCGSLTSIEIPNSVTSIGDRAFEYCSGLTSIEIPNSVTSIGDRAFEYCSSLTSIAIPNSVTSIGEYAFSGCSLTRVDYGGTKAQLFNSICDGELRDGWVFIVEASIVAEVYCVDGQFTIGEFVPDFPYAD